MKTRRCGLGSFSTFLVLCLAALPGLAQSAAEKASFQSSQRPVEYEVFDGGDRAPLVVLLHGASGPDAPLYRSQASLFARSGYTVLLLHYFDATNSRLPSSGNYDAWVKAVQDLIGECARLPRFASRPLALVGYSLGASVALAAGSQGAPVRGIAEWYGSLPDAYFYKFQGMPPLLILHGARDGNIPVVNAEQLVKLCGMKTLRCESQIYADQPHGFTGDDLRDADERTLAFLSQAMR